MVSEQSNIFDFIYDETYKIKKPIRLIEMFAGYGSQALALKYLGVNFEHWKIAEWAIQSIQAYKDMHFQNDDTNYSEKLSNDEVVDKLYKMGVSKDYNNPATKEEIKRIDFRKIYNNIITTNNLVNVCNVYAKDLNIIDREMFTYLMTYSFPCQDLSTGGKRFGMKKCSNTRSGLLWEIERILDECEGNLPQVLLMENVPELINQNNKKDFQEWEFKLQSLGYSNYVKVLDAKDYGIPQSRKRVFMISILGGGNYRFPKQKPLETLMFDLMEEQVDEKYYLSNKQIENIKKWNAWQKPLEQLEKTMKNNIAPTLTARSGFYAAGMILIKNETRVVNNYEIAPTTVNKDSMIAIPNKPQVIGGIGNKCNNDMQYHQQNKIYDNSIAISCTTSLNPYYIDYYSRIRKLTPKEYFRLMGVKDEDYERVAKNQSEGSLYHLAGDSIVVNVLMAIFSKLL